MIIIINSLIFYQDLSERFYLTFIDIIFFFKTIVISSEWMMNTKNLTPEICATLPRLFSRFPKQV